MNAKNELVVKSNRLVEASYRLTLAEQRIILYAIVEARRTQKGLSLDDFVTITAADYAAMYDVPLKQAYEQIKEAALTLYERGFVLYDTYPDTGTPRTIKGRWVAAISYIDKAGAIQLQFSGLIVPYITRLEAEFTRYKLEKVAKMSSAYAIRLYELLMQWGSVGRREIELDWLKKTLMVDKDYPRLFDFKKWVIDVALFQINEFSDLTVSYEQRKTGRVVTHFIFTFALKAPADTVQPPTENIAADVRESPLFQRLRNLGIGPKLAGQWLQQDGGRVAAALDYVEGKIEKGEVQGKAAGYFRRVFESGSEFGESAFAADVKAKAKAEAEAKKRAEAEQRAKEKAEREATEQAKAVIRTLPALERLMLAEEYRKGPGADYSNSWDPVKGDFRQAIERIQFNVWLIDRFKPKG